MVEKTPYAENLKRIIDDQGISKGELSRRLDTTRACLKHFFDPHWNPKANTLLRISAAIPCEPQEILGVKSDKLKGGKK